MDTWSLELAVIDWIALGLLVTGYFVGLNKGLGPIFGMLLFLIAAIWVGQRVGPFLLRQMPNTAPDATNWHSQFMAFGAVTGALLALPVLAKILAVRAGKKKKEEDVHSKHFGSLVGMASAALFFTLACPYAHRFEVVSKSYRGAASPKLAAGLASNMQYLFPDAHRKAFDLTLKGGSTTPRTTPPAAQAQAKKPRPPTMR